MIEPTIIQRIGNNGIYVENCINELEHILSFIDKCPQTENRLGSQVYVGTFFEEPKYVWNLIDNSVNTLINMFKKEFSLKVDEYYKSRDFYNIVIWKIGANIGLHTDSWEADGIVYIPDMSIVIYLTDDFEGAELFFPEHDIMIKPKAGSGIIFDSKTMHRVSELKSGRRITTGVNLMKDVIN